MEKATRTTTSALVDPQWAEVHTPLKLKSWSLRLRHHLDADYFSFILRGIQYGFRIGVNPELTLRPANKNMPSAPQQPEIIDSYRKDELHKGNIMGPFSPQTTSVVHLNRIGVIPKKQQPGKWRLITDLSYPDNASVNNAIDPTLCSLKQLNK